MSNCFLCGRADIEILPTVNLTTEVICPACGHYRITDIVILTQQLQNEGKRKHLLSALTRRASDAGSIITIESKNLSQLLDSAPKFDSPVENLNLTLLLVMRNQNRADEYLDLQEDRNFPLVYAHDQLEFIYFEDILIKQGLFGSSAKWHEFRLTPEGWARALELQKAQRISKQAFVAMNFAPGLYDAWENGIKPALESTGFTPYRVDQEEYNDRIDDRIIAGIRQSGLLVADFTGHRQGVYFEAGFALGLGIPVIWTCKDTDVKEAHFDTRQYNHVVWADPLELKSKLSFRISATISH